MHGANKYDTEYVREREIEKAFAAITVALEKRKHQLLEGGKAMIVAKKCRLQIQQKELAKFLLIPFGPSNQIIASILTAVMN